MAIVILDKVDFRVKDITNLPRGYNNPKHLYI